MYVGHGPRSRNCFVTGGGPLTDFTQNKLFFSPFDPDSFLSHAQNTVRQLLKYDVTLALVPLSTRFLASKRGGDFTPYCERLNVGFVLEITPASKKVMP